MAAVSGVAAVSGMVYAFVNQITDVRDMNQDGRVTVIEDYVYTTRHHKVAFGLPVPSPAAASSGEPASATGGVAVAPVFNVVV